MAFDHTVTTAIIVSLFDMLKGQHGISFLRGIYIH